jgi:diaminopimelate epimerase
MGVPAFDPKKIPVAAEGEVLDDPKEFAGQTYRISCVSTGTAHTVIFVRQSPLGSPAPEISRVIETHPLFPERTSVLWAHVRSGAQLELAIWERGVGETLGCGTGACAAAVVAARLALTGRKVTVVSKGGRMVVEWRRSGEVLLTGDAVEVFRGTWIG